MALVKVTNLSQLLIFGTRDGNQIPIDSKCIELVDDTPDIQYFKTRGLVLVEDAIKELPKVIQKANKIKKEISNDGE